MREIVLDTETTGFDPTAGHRLVEIGCIELYNRLPTGRFYHTYINPKRDMPLDAFKVHGLSIEFLSKHRGFEEVYKEFLDFIGLSCPLVIHNARFDMNFLNVELQKIGSSVLPFERAVDTLKIAKEKFPGAPATLDALCKRFKVDNSRREKHGALLDAELLAEVYLELMGGRQIHLALQQQPKILNFSPRNKASSAPSRLKRVFTLNPEEERSHEEFLKKLNSPLWLHS
jgi:DNA polymerase-3 subunit epsilon